jgi:hypothetical protein
MSDSEAALLVVDDIEDNRFALSRRLARQGYLNVTTAADGRQAFAHDTRRRLSGHRAGIGAVIESGPWIDPRFVDFINEFGFVLPKSLGKLYRSLTTTCESAPCKSVRRTTGAMSQ